MISYGDMLDVVEKAEANNAPPTMLTPPTMVETPKETSKKDEDNIEDVIDERVEKRTHVCREEENNEN